MNDLRKAAMSVTTFLLMGLTLTCDARADLSRNQVRDHDDVQTCVAEIGKRASYDGGTRVVHWVTEIKQKNLVETEIRVDTRIYARDTIIRSYSTACTTAALGKPVKVRIKAVDTETTAPASDAIDAAT